ncbi:MAG: polyprenyl synthetase family protein [Treponema sp.]|jgi:octaprenyl-diphosphate synthase|nr:polyprenyl synthetase family protein [Treponema sp.]
MDRELGQRLEKIEAVLDTWLPAAFDSGWAARIFPGLFPALGPIPVTPELLASLARPCRDLLSRGGKRWRPLLMTLICETLGGGDAALPLSPLVEFCHNASLIHDDIEDNSDQRRGAPAVHVLYGTDTAINAGSFFYFLPLACVEAWEVPAERKARALGIWGDYMRRLHLGQAMDIHWHRDFDSLPALDAYYTMCGLKTGCLARLAAVLGVLAALPAPGAQAGEAAERLGSAAEKLGVGFQILDDVKNLRTGLPGKKRGDDVVEGKKSLPVLLYLHGETGPRRALVSRCFSRARTGGVSVPEVEELIAALEAEGVVEQSLEQGQALIREAAETFALPSIAGLPLGEEGRRLLAGLIGRIS